MKARVASAGTGKTTQLVLGVLRRIGDGTPLRRIACVTFTTTAADQLREKIRAGVHAVRDDGSFLDGVFTAPAGTADAFAAATRELDGLTATTIHGFMGRCLRLVAPTLGLRSDLQSIGEWEARAVFEEAVDSLRFLAGDPEHALRAAFSELGPHGRDRLLDLFARRSLALELRPDDDAGAHALLEVFDAAMERYRARLGPGLLAPAEIERAAVRLADTPGARDRVVGRFPVVLVDEFQDVNPVQGVFFERLEGAGAEVEVVGDPKQSIYGFRHADIEVFRRALRRGERLPDLTTTRRHAPVIARFLNALTSALADRELGFVPEEAPPVEPANDRAEERGKVELHWVSADRPIAELREREARVLAGRLAALHAEGRPFGEMAVLARSYASLDVVEEALLQAGVPYVLLQGRGYYERTEIRDLIHALRVAVDPHGTSLAAWLRSPFGQLGTPELERVMTAPDPAAELVDLHPEVHDRLEALAALAERPPVAALAGAMRAPLIDGRSYASFLDARARENVDALLFTVAEQPPRDMAALLERLAHLSRQADAGDVPQSGDGVELLTVHRSKGLEWPVVAVFDVGRMAFRGGDDLYVHPETGVVSLPDSPGFSNARAAHADRDEQESYRLLYVAASRARDVLLLTGSVKGGPRGAPEGWAIALAAMGLGPDAEPWQREDFVLQTHHPDQVEAVQSAADRGTGAVDAAPWIDDVFTPPATPPIQSPSRFRVDEERFAGASGGVDAGMGESRPSDTGPAAEDGPDAGTVPGRGAAIGTLVHWAIAHDADPIDPSTMANLRAQEVMFPFEGAERDEILDEVRALLTAYHDMLGTSLPALAERAVDRPELPFAFPARETVWQGVIDRLYRVGDVWFIDDYKTDRTVAPERYHLQAAVYRRAVVEAAGIEPEVRLVYLRSGEIVPLGSDDLSSALDAADTSV